MDDKLQNSENHRSARRRLIKGSFSAPAALTLCSGSAFANASNQRCVNNSALAGEKPGVVSGSPSDQWIRVRAYKYDVVVSGNSKRTFWIRGIDVSNKLGSSTGTLQVKDASGTFLTTANALCVAAPTGTGFVANTIYSNATSPLLPALPQLSNKYYAVLVATNGDIVGISTVTTVTGGAVSNTCWNSFGGLA